jgi:hypothetical protein
MQPCGNGCGIHAANSAVFADDQPVALVGSIVGH